MILPARSLIYSMMIRSQLHLKIDLNQMKKAAANRVKLKTSRQWRVMWLLSVRLTIITILIITGFIYVK